MTVAVMPRSDLEEKLDKRALIVIYEKHSPGLYRYAYRRLGQKDNAEECVAETFTRFLKALSDGRGPTDNVQAYLYRTAHNWIADFYRRNPPPDLPLDPETGSDGQDNPSSLVTLEFERQRLRSALRRLSPDQQVVIELRFFEGWSHDQVAEVLGKSAEASRALQKRALSTLRALLLAPEDVIDA